VFVVAVVVDGGGGGVCWGRGVGGVSGRGCMCVSVYMHVCKYYVCVIF
jgi:hypothetical protein